MARRKRGSKIDYSELAHLFVPYRRVSTREQADSGAGIAAQTTVITHALNYRGATPVTWECLDEGKSGKSLDRKGLDQALHLVRSGQAGGIVVSKLDRLSRSLLDFATLMAAARNEGWNIVALDLGVDLSTPAGAMMANILAVFAEFERQVIGERTKDGLAEKRAQGVRLGRPRSLDDDLLGDIVQAYLLDRNFSAVARLLNECEAPTPHGGKKWYPATIQKAVTSQDGQLLMRMAA